MSIMLSANLKYNFSRFCPLFIYCLLMEQYVLILSVGTCLCILFNTFCMYIMYLLNVSVCVNEWILS